MVELLSQVDPLSGGAGWVGAGLLGAVLAWLLLKHLPDKDKQLTLFISDKDKAIVTLAEGSQARIDEQRKEFTRSLSEMIALFKQEAGAERVACEKHFATLAESMNSAFRTLGEQLQTHSARNQQWLDLLKQQIEKEKAKETH